MNADKQNATIAIVIVIIIIVLLTLLLPTATVFYDESYDNILQYFTTDQYRQNIDNEFRTFDVEHPVPNQGIPDQTMLICNKINLKNNSTTLAQTHAIINSADNILNKITYIQLVGGRINNTFRFKEFGNISNFTLCAILPLSISGTQKSGIWCDGQTKFFEEFKWVVYDCSHEQMFFNKSKGNVTRLLVLFIARTDDMPLGISNSNINVLT